MNVLGKILEEIKGKRENLIDMSDDEPELHDVEEWYDDGVNAGKVKAYLDVEDIIHSHMNNHSGDFNEMVSKWIPVEDTDHTPENESYVLVSFSNFNVPDIARYEENEEGGTYYPGDDEESYLKYGLFVNAWQPLPKPYRPDPCHGCFGAANNDCRNCDKI